MGSIESSDCIKRHLASQSLQTNLKHKTYCELFPDLVKEAEDELKHRMEALIAEQNNQNGNSSIPENNPLNPSLQNQEQSTLHNTLTNLCVIIGFIIFAFIVKYVIKSISIE